MRQRIAWTLVFMIVAAWSARFLSTPARSEEPSGSPFVGVTCDSNGRWLALRANGDVYLSEGKSWLDRMEYRYTIETLEVPYKLKETK
ncbi:MAG: hypothetical protein ABIK65_00135 [Candidatus Eisenbacteria bacterium]